MGWIIAAVLAVAGGSVVLGIVMGVLLHRRQRARTIRARLDAADDVWGADDDDDDKEQKQSLLQDSRNQPLGYSVGMMLHCLCVDVCGLGTDGCEVSFVDSDWPQIDHILLLILTF